MDILLRDIDKDVVNQLDYIAKKDKVSRNDLLKEYLEMLTANKKYKDENNDLKYAIEKLSKTFSYNQERLSSLEKNFENILLLIAISAGIEIDDIPAIINNYKNNGGVES